MLAPITEATFGEDALLRLNLASAAAYPAFLRDLAAATGRSLQSGAPGTLFVALDRDQLEALERLYEFQRGLGLAAESLRGSRCRSAGEGPDPPAAAPPRGGPPDSSPREDRGGLPGPPELPGARRRDRGGGDGRGAGIRHVADRRRRLRAAAGCHRGRPGRPGDGAG